MALLIKVKFKTDVTSNLGIREFVRNSNFCNLTYHLLRLLLLFPLQNEASTLK